VTEQEHNGDTPQSRKMSKGERAEKGDKRRHNPVHSGPTHSSRDALNQGETQRPQGASHRSDSQGAHLEDE
jgi:hypothetical protein